MNDLIIPPTPFAPTQKWDPRLILDLAIAIDPLEEILSRHDLSYGEYKHLMGHPVFRRELAFSMRDVRENGLTFKAKARVQAESYLIIADEIVQDPRLPAAVRLSAIRDVVRWAQLEPKDEKTTSGAVEGGKVATVNVQINF